MFRILVRLGFVILLLLLASAVPLVAQQTELTLEELASRVRALIISQEDTLGRVIALETAVASLGEEVLAPTKVVTNGNVNIRRGPGTEYEIIGTARKGDVFTLIDNESELTWWEVEFGEGSGWIHAYYVDMIGVGVVRAEKNPPPHKKPPGGGKKTTPP
ncbi:MAG: SH3 domain-containing protein, partial [Caldilineaceae bacterium]|nr:SH3 domain-containing protein [Caldilineaceae bacterium]